MFNVFIPVKAENKPFHYQSFAMYNKQLGEVARPYAAHQLNQQFQNIMEVEIEKEIHNDSNLTFDVDVSQ